MCRASATAESAGRSQAKGQTRARVSKLRGPRGCEGGARGSRGCSRAAEDLDGAVGHAEADSHHLVLSESRQTTGGLAAIEGGGGLPDQQARTVDLDRHVREHERDGLTGGDRLPEGLALFGVVPRDLEGGARRAEGGGGDGDPATVDQAPDGGFVGVQACARRNPDAGQGELDRRQSVQAQVLLGLGRKALGVRLDHERGQGVVLGGDHDYVARAVQPGTWHSRRRGRPRRRRPWRSGGDTHRNRSGARRSRGRPARSGRRRGLGGRQIVVTRTRSRRRAGRTGRGRGWPGPSPCRPSQALPRSGHPSRRSALRPRRRIREGRWRPVRARGLLPGRPWAGHLARPRRGIAGVSRSPRTGGPSR